MDERLVTVFGGGSLQPGDPAYREARRLGRALARAGLGVASGGYGGVMEAVSRGAAEAGGRALGVTCARIERWRGVRPNPWLTGQVRCRTLSGRARRLIELGAALIALPGGVGTLSELAQAWSLLQVGEIGPRPLVAVGPAWARTLETFLRAAHAYLAPGDERLLQRAADVPAAVRIVLRGLEPPPAAARPHTIPARTPRRTARASRRRG
jgi:uncharacterized protein (TIGR00730 family)